jgi:integrase
MKDVRASWARALKDAEIEYFKLYNLRHSYASRLSAAGVPDLFVAQMIGHSSTRFCRDTPRRSTSTAAMQFEN